VLACYRRLLELRRATPALCSGGIEHNEFRLLDGSPNLLAWRRSVGTDTWFTYINPSDHAQDDDGAMIGATIVLCTDAALEGCTITSELPAGVAWLARRSGTM